MPSRNIVEEEDPAPHVYTTTSNGVSVTATGNMDEKRNELSNSQSVVDEEIHELARRFTSQSQGIHDMFPVDPDGPLDPSSQNFNARKWARAFYNLRSNVGGKAPPRTSSVAFRGLSVHGYGTTTDYQKSVGNAALKGFAKFGKLWRKQEDRIDILHNLEAVVESGEMLAVLGPPGSGCSTLLKTIAGDTHGLWVGSQAEINYQGITPKQMQTAFRGEAIYTAEVDAHFPHMTVGDTLYFAARARCPKNIPNSISRDEYSQHLCNVAMTMFGISHTKDTRVGDDFIRGVSGGERKRVTIAEAALSYSPLQCWDNSTRGLDSANALEFCRTLRVQADMLGTTACVSLYQASQDAYNVFDKVIVLYEGRQIFFGRASAAKGYFEGLGFQCPDQQTTADFLTSMTSHTERLVQPGWEGKTPRSPDEFAEAWKRSQARSLLISDLDSYVQRHPFGGEHFDKFLASRRQDQSDSQRSRSPFTLSYWNQVTLTLWRSWLLFIRDPSVTITMLIASIFQSLITASIFYNMPLDSNSISRRGIYLFMIVLTNAFTSILEIMSLYAKRKIVEKHARYALCHPSAEALAAVICDLPYKVVNSIVSNILLYFMANLRRESGPFFFFLLAVFIITLTMSMMFRLLGSLTKTIALAPASVILLVIMLYTGFAIKVQNMQVWLGWLRWVNPVHYGFEALMLNEFVGQQYDCASFVPTGSSYDAVLPSERVCSVAGARPGESFIDGTAYLTTSYGYLNSHKWRNFGIMIAFMVFFTVCHLFGAEFVASEKSKGEVLVFSRKAIRPRSQKAKRDVETQQAIKREPITEQDQGDGTQLESSKSVFHWTDICYDVKVKEKDRRILDHVDGWVKPGTLTALMGVSGAGKTTLLDVLASRVTMGIVTGSMLVDGNIRDQSFQRKTGYVTQQDLHLHTSTVREALTFSALLRQPSKYSVEEKTTYVDTVIDLLEMADYAEAIIGVQGEGLNVEQRKRLTIGVELAARPQLLLFLDEPTSGLDSQTSWSICNLLQKLTSTGQAILCTIHQPSAILFQRFDRLLLLAKGGRTVYFGDIGRNSQTLLDYFSHNGAPKFPPGENPAEYMLEVIGAALGAHTDIDWPAVWRQSPEYHGVQRELERLNSNRTEAVADHADLTEFAAPTGLQFSVVIRRAFQQYWRNPTYIFSKAALSVGAALFIGLSFLNADNNQSGLQNQMFGVFIFLTFFSQLVDQMMPVFVAQRTLYEARERPAKVYTWKAFLTANILVEMAYNTAMSILSYLVWYFPMGLYRNARETGAEHSRGVLVLLFIWSFFIFTTSFAFLFIAGMDNAEMAGGVVGLLTIMMFVFCGIIAGPDTLPGFWIFMYRVNPFTYFVEGFLGTALSNASAYCASNEYLRFDAPSNSTCLEYMTEYMNTAGAFLANDDAIGECEFCPVANTNGFLMSVNIDFANRWRNWGLMWVFIVFNLAGALLFFWLLRVPKVKRAVKVKKA